MDSDGGPELDGHACLLAFDTDDAMFARGFEAGRVWGMLRAAPEEAFSEAVHAANAEMMIRMAEATDREFTAKDLGGDWVAIRFGPSRAEELREDA